MSAERECSPQPKNTWVFCSVNCLLLARFWGASDPFYFLPVPLYGFRSVWDLGSLLWCVVVFYCWYVEQMFWGPFRANTIMFGCSGPSLVSQELPSRPAGPCFLHPFFQMHCPYFPRKPLDSALHEGNYRPLHTFDPKCLWCRDCGLQNLWGTDLSFSLAMYLAYSTVRHQVNNIGNNDANRYDRCCSGDQKNPFTSVKSAGKTQIHIWDPNVAQDLLLSVLSINVVFITIFSDGFSQISILLPFLWWFSQQKWEEIGIVSAMGGLMATSTLNKH